MVMVMMMTMIVISVVFIIFGIPSCQPCEQLQPIKVSQTIVCVKRKQSGRPKQYYGVKLAGSELNLPNEQLCVFFEDEVISLLKAGIKLKPSCILDAVKTWWW